MRPTIEELQKEIERLKRLAHHDELTGILNRHGFREEVERVFQAVIFRSAGKEKRNRPVVPFSLVFFDVDNFKKVNDTYGHDVGDAVLKFVSHIAGSNLRQSDVLARWGGEEFVISLIGAPEEVAARIAGYLREKIAESPMRSGDIELPITASFGIAEYEGEESIDELVAKADKAMYHAKKNLGRNAVARFSKIQ